MAEPAKATGRIGSGLSAAEVEAARAAHGWNELARVARTPAFVVLLRQFTSLLVVILFVAAAIALILGETIDAIAIGLVILLNGVLGFVQEWKAENALEALRSMMTPYAMVLRDGVEMDIPARELVPGDIVILNGGDSVPADIDLVLAADLRVDESVLTGESVPVNKRAGAEGDEGRVFAGTAIVSGRAEGQVTAIGSKTAFGNIAELTGSVGAKQTHLQVRLGQLARQLGLAAILIAIFIILVGVFSGRPLTEMFLTGLSLAVAMVPEGLPAVVTITLALGAGAMSRRNALVRRLQAVETLGAASVICTDKTGTLTENKMTATKIWTLDRDYDVTGTGYDPAGHIETAGRNVRAENDPVLAALLKTAATCTHASIRREGHDWHLTGSPTEGALVTLACKGWVPMAIEDVAVAEMPFTSERKKMSLLVRGPEGYHLHAKGAPEALLAMSAAIATRDGVQPLTEARYREVHRTYEDMAAKGLRVIALASRPAEAGDIEERDMTFLGLVGLIDPPRPEVREAIRATKSAGIRVVMITGDSPITAQAIADQLGLARSLTVTGAELEAKSDEELAEILRHDTVFARTLPAHKMRIVEALQAQGHVVAMTGDGVNDAPALKQADIGIAMGIRGTDVSKEAADVVLLDDNFATIVGAVAEGRRQFENVRKFVRYLLASNAGEVIAILVSLLIGGPLIFLATQILWMNLVTDGLTAVALGMEKSEPEQMKRPPRGKDEPILGRAGLLLILAFGVYTGTATLLIFEAFLPMGEDLARSTAFTAMVVFEKVSVFAFRSFDAPCTRIGWASNRFLIAALTLTLLAQVAAVSWAPMQLLLHTVALSAEGWLMVAMCALPLLVVPEIVKLVRARGA